MESNICLSPELSPTLFVVYQEKKSNYHLNLDVLAPMSLCYYRLLWRVGLDLMLERDQRQNLLSCTITSF
jgi:hypothetical protein